MESILFATLTATEEANLSGGRYGYKDKKKEENTKPAPTPTPTPTPPLLPSPLVNINTILQLNLVVLSKGVIASNTATIPK
ncbi:hypothetical protein NIES4072_07260 [Nostoc commune NIES-4072]|uniref:Uncharacterized protein n=1 Tax=Nostoc commune NIES-4072 TaxID=2005467 RepID=A0A2R5FF21_NOSCO|nr:hypothetical protein [Nostoc commune]BBD65599.1 hypothetical protein NIES4070_19570 [Nostoc commune HK-02]GBG17077.1 hypothetical protein NIES4072_07260 [Nostoc commune NIES-4072]